VEATRGPEPLRTAGLLACSDKALPPFIYIYTCLFLCGVGDYSVPRHTRVRASCRLRRYVQPDDQTLLFFTFTFPRHDTGLLGFWLICFFRGGVSLNVRGKSELLSPFGSLLLVPLFHFGSLQKHLGLLEIRPLHMLASQWRNHNGSPSIRET